MHRTTTIVALATSSLFTTVANAQVTFVFEDSGQALGNSDSRSVTLGDLDGDGDLDAMVGNLGQPNTVWTNDGNGTFTNSGQALGNSFSRSVALGDIDGDGDLDAMVANVGPNTVWFADPDRDGDGVGDTYDGCPDDPNKTEPGNCGCGVADTPGSGLWDLDCDGDYDEDDIRLAMAEYGITEGTPGDMDGDGDTDRDDWELLGAELGICLGDINGDGQVDAADLGLLIGAWGLCP